MIFHSGNLNKNWKTKVFPSVCLFLYVLFTSIDTYTTFLSSPDLKLETNPVFLYFKWGWSTHLLYISAMVLMTIVFAIISNNLVIKYFANVQQKTKPNKFLFAISILLLIYCFYNLIATAECSVNNYLVYRYQYVISDSIIQKIAIDYVNLNFYFNQKYGLNSLGYFVCLLEVLLACLITFNQTYRVGKNVKLAIAG